MSRRRVTGIKSAVRRSRDGSIIRVDYYDRSSGEFLGHDRDEALKKAAAARGILAAAKVESFSDLCTAYLASPEFAELAASTQKLNRLYVDQLRIRFAALPPRAITQAVVRKLRDLHVRQPYKGNRLVATLRLVLGYGQATGVLKENTASKPGKLRERARSRVATHEQIERLLRASRTVEMRRAVSLMLYTVQRPADVLRLGPQNLSVREGRTWLTLRQSKTDELVDIPLHRRAADILAEPLPPRTSRRAQAVVAPALLIPSPTGRPWLYRNFFRQWEATRRRADWHLARERIAGWPKPWMRTREQTEELKRGLRAEMVGDLQLRDFRRTGMVMMSLGGATPQKIASVSGHSIERVVRILDTYIPRRSELAEGAIDAWEQADPTKVVRLPTARKRK